MDFKLTLTLSDRLFDLLDDKLPNLGRRIEKAVTKEAGAKIRKSEMSIKIEPIEPAEPKNEPDTAPAATIEKIPSAVAEAAARAEAAAKEKSRNLGVEIREIIHRTRQRFEGEDYKENAGSELRKKYHDAVGHMLLQIAATLGYEKPSFIDNSEKVDQFAAECDALILDENGNISAPAASF